MSFEMQPFDQAVVKVVETIALNIGRLGNSLSWVATKQDILNALQIPYSSWGNMKNGRRNVTTKAGRQAEIISTLENTFSVNPDYIRNYPNVPNSMMFTSNQFRERGPEYGLTAPEMRRHIKHLESVIADLKASIQRLENDSERQSRIIEAQSKLLFEKTPRKRTSPDKKPDK